MVSAFWSRFAFQLTHPLTFYCLCFLCHTGAPQRVPQIPLSCGGSRPDAVAPGIALLATTTIEGARRGAATRRTGRGRVKRGRAGRRRAGQGSILASGRARPFQYVLSSRGPWARHVGRVGADCLPRALEVR